MINTDKISKSEGLDLVNKEVWDEQLPSLYACFTPDGKVNARMFNFPSKMEVFYMIRLLCDVYEKLPDDLSSTAVEGSA